jgi:cytidine deaminase
VLGDVIRRLQSRNWLAEDKKKLSIEELIDEAMASDPASVMKGSHLANSIEYFRAVHAEMAAIVDAARRGVSVKDAILYCTTFPCHDCAKHIVAAGIQKVVYVEPYPKSLAPELYLDSIVVDQPRSKETTETTSSPGYVSFESFVGIAPRQYMDLFTMGERKTKAGDVVLPNKASAKPLFGKELPPELAVLVKENQEFNRFKEEMSAKIASLIIVPQKNPQSDVVQMKKPEVQGGS